MFQNDAKPTEGEGATPKENGVGTMKPEEMTSKDYYFDSYGHFGIHEVRQTNIQYSQNTGYTCTCRL